MGRAQELVVLGDFVRSATRSGGVELVTGDAGMGKTALLKAAARAAAEQTGARVLHASGVEFEADLGYAALNQLLLPAAQELSELRRADATALRAALGLESVHPPELLQLTMATVHLLHQLSQSRPLLLVVDDLQWLDRASLLLLSVVARRLDDSAVALLLAQRSGHETFFDRASIPTLDLSPLSDDDAHTLLREHHPGLHPSVRQRIVADAGGNPLGLIELPRGLTVAQEAATEPLPTTLPLSLRLRRLFESRVSALPAPSRLLLLLAALHHGDGSELMRIVAGSTADLGPAETAGLVSVHPGTRLLSFSHPLVRAAVVDLASAPERRSAHRRLSQLTSDPHVRALHLADSVLGTDDDVARLLDDVADAALARGDAARAVAVLLRAAELTSIASDRARRLAAAAYLGANVTGALAGAPALLARARTDDPDSTDTLQVATAAAAHLLNSDGGVDTAHRMLARALAAVLPDLTEPRVVEEAVHTLMLVCAFGGREELWAAFEEAVARSAAVLSPELRLAAVTFADPARASGRQLADLDALVTSVDDAANPVQVLEVAIAGQYVDREPAAALDRVVLAGRSGGPVALAAQALVMRAMTAFHEGRWEDAATLADEGISLCVEHGYRLLEWGALNPRMLLAAACGDTAYLAAVRGRLHQWAIPRQMLAARTFTANVDGLAALSQGRYGEAHDIYSSIATPGTLPPHAQVLVWNLFDVVEAAVCSGHVEEARRHAAAAAATLAPISPRLRFQSEAAAALVAPDREYSPVFDAVVNNPGSARWPFQLARLELAYGERLRLDRAMRRARPHLELASELFTALGAKPWIERTEAVLRATGRIRHATDHDGRPRLTPQELQVTRLAAAGLSNRAIGDRLFLSPRTVGAHLYRAFPKLGVTSRAALRDALSEFGDQLEGPATTVRSFD
ncbi:MAG TPA: AAA family ATPase [Propionicimonas sp.]|nr:AAA family ATPase [Propionicimonas sp.]